MSLAIRPFLLVSVNMSTLFPSEVLPNSVGPATFPPAFATAEITQPTTMVSDSVCKFMGNTFSDKTPALLVRIRFLPEIFAADVHFGLSFDRDVAHHVALA